MDLARPRAFKALEAVVELGEFTQYQVWKKAGTSFDTAHRVVKFLQEKNVVSKTGGKYMVSTWPGLLGLFAAYRTFPKPVASLQLALDQKQALDYLAENKFVLCLTSAWKYYDDYLRDPQLHVYSPSEEKAEKTVSELSQLAKGTLLIHVYLQDLPVTPVKQGKFLATSLPRTVLDLYSSHYAYGTDNWIKRKAEVKL